MQNRILPSKNRFPVLSSLLCHSYSTQPVTMLDLYCLKCHSTERCKSNLNQAEEAWLAAIL